MSAPTITFLVTLLSSFAVFFIFAKPDGSSKSAQQRLVMIQESLRSIKAGPGGAQLEKSEKWARLGAFLSRFGFSERIKLLLTHAHSGMGVGGLVVGSAGAALLCGVAGFVCSRMIQVGAVASMVGATVPFLILRMKKNRRVKAFNAALPDAIDLMARSLVAGHSMGSAIEMIAEQSPEPLAFEFVQVFQQQRLGLQFRDALLQMGARVPSRDLHFLITAILVQKETGGDLAEILDRAAHVIRERIRIEGEVRTHTAQGRLTGWILALLPVLLLILLNLISPGYSTVLFEDPLGQKLLYTGGTFIVIGALVIRKVVDVQV